MTVVDVRTDGPSLVEGFRRVAGEGPMRQLEALARKLRGHRIVMVNSTATGGGVAIVGAFAYRAAPITSVLYALGEGSLLGIASRYYDLRFDGIVSQALVATLCIFLAVYLLYSLRIVRVTSRFATGVIAATGGFLLLYLVVWLLSLFGVNFAFLNAPTPLGIGISVLIVILGALNLTLDFAFIEQAAAKGAPRFMQWYAAFGLMVSLIWIYVSVLRLIALLRARQ